MLARRDAIGRLARTDISRRRGCPSQNWPGSRADSGGTTPRRNARRRRSTASARCPGSAATKCATWWPNAPRRCRSQRPGSAEAEIPTCQFPSKWLNVTFTVRLTLSTTASSLTSETFTAIVLTTTTGRCSASSAPPVPVDPRRPRSPIVVAWLTKGAGTDRRWPKREKGRNKPLTIGISRIVPRDQSALARPASPHVMVSGASPIIPPARRRQRRAPPKFRTPSGRPAAFRSSCTSLPSSRRRRPPCAPAPPAHAASHAR